MTEIELKNGSKLQVSKIVVSGKVIDSNGTEIGGSTQYAFLESEIAALNTALPLQQIYNAVFPQTTEAVESGE
jgi:hypothetical protein